MRRPLRVRGGDGGGPEALAGRGRYRPARPRRRETESPGDRSPRGGFAPYEGADSDAFLDLVPGPRGRDGLPECLGFWKRRIESCGDTEAFPVGVIYGPTGSGKSSLVAPG